MFWLGRLYALVLMLCLATSPGVQVSHAWAGVSDATAFEALADAPQRDQAGRKAPDDSDGPDPADSSALDAYIRPEAPATASRRATPDHAISNAQPTRRALFARAPPLAQV